MNQATQTIVSGELYDEMRKAKVADGYEPVPADMQSQAGRILAGRGVADMTPEFKRQLRNKRKAKHRAGVPGY